MKKIFLIKRFGLLITVPAIIVIGCHKSGTTTTPPDDNISSTDLGTKAQYNNTSSGVYKGVIIGSTGTIVFSINNGNNAVKGFLTIDNIKDTLTTTQTIVPGQPINNVTFTGRISSMKLSANADGSNATLTNINIVGHSNAAILIIHENSTKQIFLYEGTYTGSLSGTINCARVGANNGDTAYVLARINDTTIVQRNAQVTNNNITVNFSSVFVIQGSFSGDNFNGTWTWTSFGSTTVLGTGPVACVRTY